MKKTVFYLPLLLLFAACNNDSEKPSEPKMLKIDVALDAPLQTDKFPEGASVGCFLLGDDGDNYARCPCNQNVPAFLGGTAWLLSKETEIVSSGNVLAYYPYNKEANDRTRIPIETASQTDYLYSGKEIFSSTQPEVTLNMKHALSLVRFNITNLPEEVKAIRLDDVCVSASLDIERASFGNQVIKSETYEVNKKTSDEIAVMAFPHEKDSVHVNFLIGEKKYPFEATGNWPQGKEITYTVNFDSETNIFLLVGHATIEDWKVKEQYELY